MHGKFRLTEKKRKWLSELKSGDKIIEFCSSDDIDKVGTGVLTTFVSSKQKETTTSGIVAIVKNLDFEIDVYWIEPISYRLELRGDFIF